MNLFAQIAEKTESVFRKFKKQILRRTDTHFQTLEQWYRDDPRNLKRSDFDFLNEKSIVFDLGGYEGQWTSDIYSRYNCYVYVFEPVLEFYEIIMNRFKNNSKIKVYQLGLAGANSIVRISKNEFASKIETRESDSSENIQLKSFNEFIDNNTIQSIELIKINIEGAEYELLEHLLSSKTIIRINCLLIQFHNFEIDAVSRRKSIQSKLSQTHTNIFEYPFVWECWKLKD